MHQQASRIGKHHPFVRAFKQLRPDTLLECRQLFGKRWLGKTKLFAGSRQRRRLRHGKEDAELVEGHERNLVGWVEEKRVLSLRAFLKPIIRARGKMMG